MATCLLRRSRSGIPILGGTLLAAHTLRTYPNSILLHADASPRKFEPASSSERARSNPLINARTARQISAGSIAGVCGGMAVSIFSKPLAIVIGLAVVIVQALESRGIRIVPYKRLETWFRGIRVESIMRENVPFKLCFGTTFALAAAGSF